MPDLLLFRLFFCCIFDTSKGMKIYISLSGINTTTWNPDAINPVGRDKIMKFLLALCVALIGLCACFCGVYAGSFIAFSVFLAVGIFCAWLFSNLLEDIEG